VEEEERAATTCALRCAALRSHTKQPHPVCRLLLFRAKQKWDRQKGRPSLYTYFGPVSGVGNDAKDAHRRQRVLLLPLSGQVTRGAL